MFPARIIAGALVAAAAALGAASGAIAQTASPAADPTVAVVNGEKIVRSDVMTIFEGLPEQFRQIPMATLFDQILQRLIDRKLLAQAAVKAGFPDRPEVQRRLANDREQILQESYLYARIEDELTDARLKTAYDRKMSGAAKDEEVRARHILLKTEDDAKAVIVEVEKGADFTDLARKRSTGPTSANGGDLGYFKRDQMVGPFSEVAFALKPGEVSKAPVRTQFGWHVIKVEDRRAAKLPSFEESKEELKTEEAQAVVKEIMGSIRTGASITLVEPDDTPVGPVIIRPAP